MRNTDRTDIYTRVTNEIVAAIEVGAGSWTMPWHHDGSAIARPVRAVSTRTDSSGIPFAAPL
ncbi:ArdC-like ssDNA-binding domain-containing protein [Novosphingobium sp. LASN5T]|uniref:ArdC-like ssDNA-binding domain-containing protein n=1 Tax=Novosphingobium sp. LASN5T TaxID=2491021 RepID=UPI002695E5B3